MRDRLPGLAEANRDPVHPDVGQLRQAACHVVAESSGVEREIEAGGGTDHGREENMRKRRFAGRPRAFVNTAGSG